MKTIYAQTATFALSALGALAILVGVIDQPQIAFGIASPPGGVSTVIAAATPAVSPLA